MPRMTAEQYEYRKCEIVDACEKIYRRDGFEGVTIKGISAATSFTRPAIYTYFETKDEILMALLLREYQVWNRSMRAAVDRASGASREQLAELLADTLSGREVLLRLQCMNLYEMESNCRTERLAEFKRTYMETLECLDTLLGAAFPGVTQTEIKSFSLTFLAFLFGVYPFTHHTDKQLAAMELVGLPKEEPSIREMVYRCLIKILPD